MVWPIIRGKSYVGETGKSMKSEEFAEFQKDGWRKIALSLVEGAQRVKSPDFRQLAR